MLKPGLICTHNAAVIPSNSTTAAYITTATKKQHRMQHNHNSMQWPTCFTGLPTLQTEKKSLYQTKFQEQTNPNSPWTSRTKNELQYKQSTGKLFCWAAPNQISLTFPWLWAFSLTLAEFPDISRNYRKVVTLFLPKHDKKVSAAVPVSIKRVKSDINVAAYPLASWPLTREHPHAGARVYKATLHENSAHALGQNTNMALIRNESFTSETSAGTERKCKQ